MTNLSPPSLKPEVAYRAVVDAKRDPLRLRLQKLEGCVIQRFIQIEHLPSGFSTLSNSPFSGTDADDLRQCYKHNTRQRSEIIAAVRSAQRPAVQQTCQYCGIDSPNETDHYLPQELFPEFSVNPQNLVPICSTCNRTKSSIYKCAGERQFVHLYFDQLPKEQYLFANVNFYDGLVTASFRIDVSQISSELQSLIRNHFARLNLLERFALASNTLIDDVISLVHTHVEVKSSVKILSFVSDEARRRAGRISINFWEAVLIRELSQSQAFSAYTLKLLES
jgi:5-methylcytosine-specific restriction endonuclease McrA